MDDLHQVTTAKETDDVVQVLCRLSQVPTHLGPAIEKGQQKNDNSAKQKNEIEEKKHQVDETRRETATLWRRLIETLVGHRRRRYAWTARRVSHYSRGKLGMDARNVAQLG